MVSSLVIECLTQCKFELLNTKKAYFEKTALACPL